MAADVVVVAADAFRSPQLLWASGIRPAALGPLPDRASGGHLHGGARRRKDAPLRHRRGPRRRTGPPLAEPRRSRGGSQPHPVLRARAPVLGPGDVHRDDAVPHGAGNPVRREPLGLRQHGLRPAQAPALRGRRHLRRRRTGLSRLPEHDHRLRAHGAGEHRDRRRLPSGCAVLARPWASSSPSRG